MNRIREAVLMLACVGLMTGCMHSNQTYYKAGVDASLMEVEKKKCRKLHGTFNPLVYWGADADFGYKPSLREDMHISPSRLTACMEEKGWRELSPQEIEAAHRADTARIEHENAARATSQTFSQETVWRGKYEAAAAETEAAASAGKLNAKSVIPQCTASTPKDTPCWR